MAIVRAPAGLEAAGRRLWQSVTSRFALAQHERLLLEQVCRTADLIARLDDLIASEGPMKGGKAHPAAVEVRQQRIVLARLLVALRIPEDHLAGAGRPQRRVGVRGVYRGGMTT